VHGLGRSLWTTLIPEGDSMASICREIVIDASPDAV